MHQSQDEPQQVPPQYLEIRNAGKSLFGKVAQASCSTEWSMLKAAKRLGIRSAGKTIIFADRAEQAALVDYSLHEYRFNGVTMIQSFEASALQLTPTEHAYLQAAKESYTSLFQIVESQPAQCQIRLRDLLLPDFPETILTDVGLSQSFSHWTAKDLIFIRIIRLNDMAFTSGFLFVFQPNDGLRILQAFQQKMKRVSDDDWSEQQFLFFFQMQRRYGTPAGFLDDTSPGELKSPPEVENTEPSAPQLDGSPSQENDE